MNVTKSPKASPRRATGGSTKVAQGVKIERQGRPEPLGLRRHVRFRTG